MTQSYRDYSARKVSQLPQYECIVRRYFYVCYSHKEKRLLVSSKKEGEALAGGFAM